MAIVTSCRNTTTSTVSSSYGNRDRQDGNHTSKFDRTAKHTTARLPLQLLELCGDDVHHEVAVHSECSQSELTASKGVRFLEFQKCIELK